MRAIESGRAVAARTGGAEDRGMMLMLVLLSAMPEPNSSAYTNASVQRTIEVPRERKPSKKTIARRAFDRVERKRDDYLRMQLSLDSRGLQEKTGAAESLERDYRAVIERGDPETSVAAWVRIAELYLHFAEQIRLAAESAGTPELKAMARGPEARARRAIERGTQEARTKGVRGAWRRRIEALRR